MYALVVLALVGGQAAFVDGFHPLTFPSYEVCEERRDMAEKYFTEFVKGEVPFIFTCVSLAEGREV